MTNSPSNLEPTAKSDGEKSDAVLPIGGDSACWAHLLCSVCGVMLEGEAHAHEAELEPRK